MNGRHAAYLEAMDIPVWVRKELAGAVRRNAASALHLGPGSGPLMLLCREAADTAGRLAADITRVLAHPPVWAWPAPDGAGPSVEAAVNEHLFTCLVVFGAETARAAFGRSAPDTVGPARVLVAPGLEELAGDPAERMRFWNALCSARLVKDR